MEAVRLKNDSNDNPEELDAAAQLRAGREVLRMEATGLWKVSTLIDSSFTDAIATILAAEGCVIVTGMGKAGHVAQKIAATLASTGTPSHFIHPAEAFHGDLGRIHRGDVVLMLTQSGETGEVVQLLPSLRDMQVPLIAVTAESDSTVGRAAQTVIELGELEEACSLGLAPSTSTTAMMALGDALALVLSRLRGFRAEDFARFHPGGSLGFKLSKVDDHMRPIGECRVARDSRSVREVIVECSRPGRRTGAVMLIDAQGELSGLFTDSDLARLVERRDEAALDRPVGEVMTSRCARVTLGTRTELAVEIMAERKISELPVVDAEGRPVGLIDVTDIVAAPRSDRDSADPVAPSVGVGERPRVRLFPGDESLSKGA